MKINRLSNNLGLPRMIIQRQRWEGLRRGSVSKVVGEGGGSDGGSDGRGAGGECPLCR